MLPPEPALADLRAYRGTPFVDVTAYRGFDYSNASFVMELRAYRDAPGAPLVSLVRQDNPAAEGISVDVAYRNGRPTSYVQARINETTLEALRFTNPRGGDLRLFYAQDIAGAGHGKARRMRGTFTLEASANG